MKLINNSISKPILLFCFSLMCYHQYGLACSMYKVTSSGKTLVGCNEDAWRLTSNIWFENSTSDNKFGAGFTGSRMVGVNKYAPQSGMNEVGLVFSRLVAFHPKKNLNQKDKKQINNEVQYLTDIMHKCSTVNEVKQYISSYDHSIFLDDVFIYVDQSGDYLIAEPYQIIEGNDSSYVLANFCPSLTNNQSARKQMRFKNGEDYLKLHGINSSLKFCIDMSDTMHVCRNRNGDGTLLTSIWDTKNGLVNLYFYHNYEATKQFNLKEELAKGNHIISIPSLFPENTEFKRLANYKTPFNLPILRLLLVFIAGGLLFLSLLLVINYFKKRTIDAFNHVKLIFSVLNLLLIAYLFVLCTNINIYYFDAPYKHYSSLLISLSSYTPFLLLIVIVPLTYYNKQYIQFNSKIKWMKYFLIINNLTYLALLIAFNYWGLLHIIN